MADGRTDEWRTGGRPARRMAYILAKKKKKKKNLFTPVKNT
jgi:hypothetical protein